MAWYDIGTAILLIIVGVVGLLVVFGCLCSLWIMLWTARDWIQGRWFGRKPTAPSQFVTSVGTFTRFEDAWEWDDHDRIVVTAHDVDGAPDPAFVARLSALLAELPRLEAIARESYEFEEDDVPPGCEPFALRGLQQADGEEVVLTFSSDSDDCDLGTVFVTLLGDEAVHAVLIH